ncbi:MAG: DUF4124 domain-containing protein [Thiohalocapsa sp.]|jgi:hypothetical protein|uniref:DUF4124 domain-containing protein n=1 Tax=Thiohalocapsa sp. TaxID=2497641 RepID=UPI0025CE12DB|nr:DUF4124 domain-containing protein [Thiohalocapsa sp.]MCG6942691.1 DUF4124 domain-containing protein [Thiohalocapsa sp.]
MKHVRLMVAAGALLLAGADPVGAEVYKSVDANGNVIYSSSPYAGGDPSEAQTIGIDPGPTSADRSAAERRVQAMQQRGGGGAGNTPPQQPNPPPAAAQKPQPMDWQEDEAVQRARSTSREERSTGGLAGDKRGRARGTISSERTSR